MVNIKITNVNDSNKNINSLGSEVITYFQPPIQLDKTKINELAVISANIPFMNPNFVTNLKFKFKYGSTFYTEYITVGLYSLDDIQARVNYFTLKDTSLKLFTFTPNEYDSTINISFNYPNCYIYLSSDSIMQTVGFTINRTLGTDNTYLNSQTNELYVGYGSQGGTNTSIATSDDIARFDTMQAMYIKVDICDGTYDSSFLSNIVACISINTLPNSQVQFLPNNLIWNSINIGNSINSIRVSLVDQNNNLLDFSNGGTKQIQNWNAMITIRSRNKHE